MHRLRLLVAVLLLILASAGRAAPTTTTTAPSNFVPPWGADVFPISFWCGPPAKFVTVERFKQMADAGFTLAMPSDQGATVETNRRILDAARAAGMKAFITDGRIATSIPSADARKNLDAVIADYSKHPALAGYFLADEPSPAAYPGLKQVEDYFRQHDPAHPPFVNLYPIYVPAEALGMSYERYVESFIETCRPFAVSYDNYHFTRHGDRPGFFENLAAVRAIALKHHVPFWNIVLCVPHGDYRPLTEAEKRFEAMQTLAYGGTGLLWFTYWQPAPKGWGDAIINYDGTPTRQYDEIKRINRDVQTLGRVLIHATSSAVYRGGDQPAADGLPVRCENKQLTIGLFAGNHGERYVLLASRDYQGRQTAALEMPGSDRPVECLNLATGRWEPIPPEALRRIELEPAGAALFRWQGGHR